MLRASSGNSKIVNGVVGYLVIVYESGFVVRDCFSMCMFARSLHMLFSLPDIILVVVLYWLVV